MQKLERNISPELSILLPVRNEAIYIPIISKLLTATVKTSHEMVIIYDDPTDNSIAAAQAIQHKYPNLKLVYNNLGPGILNALRKGMQNSTGQYVLITCVDEVGPLLSIDDMVELLRQGCDLVSGTRYSLGGRRLTGSAIGKFLSISANLLFWMCGSALRDVTTGFKMFKRSCFDQLNLQSRPIGWIVVFEIGIKAQLLNFRLGEVPILALDRLYGGQSTFQAWQWSIEYLKLFWWGAKQLRTIKTRPKVMVRIPVATPKH